MYPLSSQALRVKRARFQDASLAGMYVYPLSNQEEPEYGNRSGSLFPEKAATLHFSGGQHRTEQMTARHKGPKKNTEVVSQIIQISCMTRAEQTPGLVGNNKEVVFQRTPLSLHSSVEASTKQ